MTHGLRRLLLATAALLGLGTLAQAYPEEVKATFRRWVQSESGGA